MPEHDAGPQRDLLEVRDLRVHDRMQLMSRRLAVGMPADGPAAAPSFGVGDLFRSGADAAVRPEPRSVHRSGYARRPNDFYATPSWVTEALLQHVQLRGPVWEPCCGTGAISEVIAGKGQSVVSTDIDDYGYGTPGVDFFACRTMPAGCLSIVTNPP